MPDPRMCLTSFTTTGTNLGGRSPSFRTRDLRRDYDNVQQTLENIGDRIEGGVNAFKRGDIVAGQFSSALNELRCPPTPYASFFSALQPPKFPFMFATKFELYPDFQTLFGGTAFPDGAPYWFVKQATRPNMNYQYEEVNMYNYRTQVLRRSEFQPATITMYDDLKDATGSWWNTYIRLMSPITNIMEDAYASEYEESGMDWNAAETASLLTEDLRTPDRATGGINTNQPGLDYAAGTGVLPSSSDLGNIQILKSIQVMHIIEFGKKAVIYTYRNPKFTEIRFNELDWEQSGPSTVEGTFVYDAFEISYKGAFTEESVNSLDLPPAYPIKVDGPVVNAGPFSF